MRDNKNDMVALFSFITISIGINNIILIGINILQDINIMCIESRLLAKE